MARTASSVQAEIDALRGKLSSGILRVRHGETETTYATPEQMQRAIDSLQAELDSLATRPVRQVRFKTSKGLAY
jgi:hypothetical protein